MKNFIPNALIITGILCYSFVSYAVFERNNPKRVAFTNVVTQANASEVHKEITALPTNIHIQSVNISLPIIPAKIANGTWELTTQGVSYLTDSPIPGEVGNSILYGHNWNNLLGDLPKVKPGDWIDITYSDGTSRHFEIEYTITVTPDQTHILAPSKDRRITLYTCTAFLDTKRFVAVALLKD
jgi:LPXTG-site transpeptidase (sortase) family protein